jgi:predicted nucleic acid-binding protein
MQSEKLEKTYIDSNIWFTYITEGKYDNRFTHAKKLIDEILGKDRSIIVTSDLVVLEMISVIRTKVVQREPFTLKAEENPNIVTKLFYLIQRYTTKFMEKFSESVDAGKMEVVQESTPTSTFMNKVQEIQNKTLGEITDSFFCRVCRRPNNSYNYSGVNHYDIQHALLARTGNVQHLATSDKGYKYLKDYFKDSFDLQYVDKDGISILW